MKLLIFAVLALYVTATTVDAGFSFRPLTKAELDAATEAADSEDTETESTSDWSEEELQKWYDASWCLLYVDYDIGTWTADGSDSINCWVGSDTAPADGSSDDGLAFTADATADPAEAEVALGVWTNASGTLSFAEDADMAGSNWAPTEAEVADYEWEDMNDIADDAGSIYVKVTYNDYDAATTNTLGSGVCETVTGALGADSTLASGAGTLSWIDLCVPFGADATMGYIAAGAVGLLAASTFF